MLTWVGVCTLVAGNFIFLNSYIHILVPRDLIRLKGRFEWHLFPLCMVIMKMLQNISQASTIRVQTLAKLVNVYAGY